MNQITNVPASVSTAGYQFNYEVWTAGTVVTLVNATWDSDYRSTVYTSGADGLDDWIDSREDRLVVSQLKHNILNRDIKIDAPFERVAGYNYIRATNPAQPVPGSLPSTYYYFIKDVEYSAPSTTTIRVQLDVWATFIRSVEPGRCYVERSHAGIANELQMQNNGRDYLAVPEGMDTGDEMEIASTWIYEVGSARGTSYTDATYSIMVTATTDLSKVGDSEDPKITTSSGSLMENLPNGASIYFFDSLVNLNAYLLANKDKSWITQAINSIVAVPNLDEMMMPRQNISLPGAPSGSVSTPTSGTIPQASKRLVSDWTEGKAYPERYANLQKFNMFPYSAMEMTTFNGQPIILKPEALPSRAVDVVTIFHMSPGTAKVSFIPKGYNSRANGNQFSDELGTLIDSGEWLDFATSITNMPSFTTVNNSANAYLVNNKNQIAFQYKNASWEQARALRGADTAYGQATSNIGQTNAMTSAGIQQTTANLNANNTARAYGGAVDAGNSLVQGVAGGLGKGGIGIGPVIGGVGNAAAGALHTGIDMQQNNANALAATSYASQANTAQTRNQAYQRDTNRDLAQFSAQGDYANSIAGIQAKIQDTAMLQPTTSGQIGGESFNLAAIGWMVAVRLKRLRGVAMREIGEYWLRYGYRVNRWMTPPRDWRTHDKFTYWKMVDAQVFSNACPEQYRQTIRGILETGVTVYSNPDDIGRIDPADNQPLGGIRY